VELTAYSTTHQVAAGFHCFYNFDELAWTLPGFVQEDSKASKFLPEGFHSLINDLPKPPWGQRGVGPVA
jgi:hypothetical protein